MKLFLISDVHFGKDVAYPTSGNESFGTLGSKFPAIFSKIVQKLNEADLLVNLGDGISAQSQEIDSIAYKRFLEHFKEVKIPVYHIIGNHDTTNLTRGQLMKLTGQQNTYFSFDKNGFHHVMLDSKWKGYPEAIDNEQISWLKDDLKKTKYASIIYMHYPCDEQSAENNPFFRGHENWLFLRQKKDLRKIFEESGNAKLVAFGHSHYFNLQKINNIIYLNAPSFTQTDGKGNPAGAYLEVMMNSSIINIDTRNIKL